MFGGQYREVPLYHVYADLIKEIEFVWVPGYDGIRGNEVADSAAEDALDGGVSIQLI